MESSQIKLVYCSNLYGLGIEQTPPATEEERPSVIPPPVISPPEIPPSDHAERNPLDEGGTADYSTTIRIAQDEGISRNSSSKRHITKLKLNLSDGRIVRLNADNNNLLSDDKTMAGLLYFSTSLLAIIPKTPLCQAFPFTNIKLFLF